jgi:2,3-bisphosphoglycerate-independent phosphoglycerate mutase
MKQPFVLTVLDGWGYSKIKMGNAIANAKTPNISEIEKTFPSLLIQASGPAVGMSWGEPGNSEVGHLTIGAGRTIYQYMSRINRDIKSGQFEKNFAIEAAFKHVLNNNSKLHILGLLTSGSVHAYFDHLLALIEIAGKLKLPAVKLHLFLDGKDSGLKEAPELLTKLNKYLEGFPNVKVASMIGRDFPMDRNNRWERTKKAYDLWIHGTGKETTDPFADLKEYYAQDLHDTFIPPTIMDKDGLISDNDAMMFFNFREDSMRQITRVFTEEQFDKFERRPISNLLVVAMTEYVETPNMLVAYPVPEANNGLAEVLSKNGKMQFHIAETEKYAHVTYFFNCLKNKPFPGETDFLIESAPDISKEPEMRAAKIADKVLEELELDLFDVYIINFANADMLAHLGNLETAVIGVEAIDTAVGRIKEAVLKRGGKMVITSDHGNAESITYRATGEAKTSHDPSPVPIYIISEEFKRQLSDEQILQNRDEARGLLADVAPTVLALMGIQKPEEMTGDSILPLIQ